MGGKWEKNLTVEEVAARERLTTMRYRWYGMKARCENPSDPSYGDYGGRGIYVEARWQNFLVFYQDMGDPPFAGAQLERKDNDGPYSKENCIWATVLEQSQNRRKNRANKSGVPGVGFFCNRWEAAGMYKGKRVKLYAGPSKEEAILARLAWEKNKKGD